MSESTLQPKPQANLLAILSEDLREYLDFRVRQWEHCLTHDNEALEASAKYLRHQLWEALINQTNQPKGFYIDIPFAMPPKIDEIKLFQPI